VEETDYQPIIRVADYCWGGCPVAVLLQRLFFVHFRSTSFAVEENGTIQGFLVGFLSQTTPTQAYIHFVGNLSKDNRLVITQEWIAERNFRTEQ
jgi:hypothetical protein